MKPETGFKISETVIDKAESRHDLYKKYLDNGLRLTKQEMRIFDMNKKVIEKLKGRKQWDDLN